MIFEEFLSKTIHSNFDSLLSEFGFNYFFVEKENRDVSFFYKKPNLLVRIKYNYPNHYLDIDLYKETDVNKLIGADNISLLFIIKDKNPHYHHLDYKAIMPDKISIEKSLEILAGLVKQYATSYLEQKEWKTWKDVKW